MHLNINSVKCRQFIHASCSIKGTTGQGRIHEIFKGGTVIIKWDKRGVDLQKGMGAGGGCAPSCACVKHRSFEINGLNLFKKQQLAAEHLVQTNQSVRTNQGPRRQSILKFMTIALNRDVYPEPRYGPASPEQN